MKDVELGHIAANNFWGETYPSLLHIICVGDL